MAGLADAPRMYRALKKVLPPITDRYFPVRVEGLDNVPEVEPVILAINHLSFIDSILVPIAIERPVYYLGKADYWDSWKTRWFFEGTGVVPVRRTGDGSGDAALATGVEILNRGDLLGIYPEGTRSPDGRLYRGKTGPVRMALEAGVRIVPVAVEGTDRAMPTGSYLPKRRPITIRYGQPLDLSRFADRRDDPFVLRSATDELMFEIMLLSGQEYVDEYASKVKSGSVKLGEDADGGTTVEIDGAEKSRSTRRAG
ncbi:MAG: lysophospholipid acyltransferase family protein [Nitriliruptor sp.]|uniref:lysophospholipid acyltransferase family protein n=1 Tax=Nitriliruptor sp. TaxID=2448056 RepID=UPI00349FFD32